MTRRSDEAARRSTWVTILFLILLVVVPFLFIGFIGRSSSPSEPFHEIEELENFIGIGFGSSYTRVGIIRNGSLVVIPNERGRYKTLLCVALTGKEILVGENAQHQSIKDPGSIISESKHSSGLPWSDRAVEDATSDYPFEIMNQEYKPVFDNDIAGMRGSLTPEYATALVFGKMRHLAEEFLGEKVTSAVVAMPASFNDNDTQWQAIKDGGSIAGLKIVRVIDQPTAAVIAHRKKHA